MPVAQSANIQEYDFNPETQTLVIAFVSGAVYRWYGVSQSDYDTFHQMGSKGSYLWSNLIPKYGRGQVMVPAAQKRRGRR